MSSVHFYVVAYLFSERYIKRTGQVIWKFTAVEILVHATYFICYIFDTIKHYNKIMATLSLLL
jgi:hypothetical protein